MYIFYIIRHMCIIVICTDLVFYCSFRVWFGPHTIKCKVEVFIISSSIISTYNVKSIL